MIKDTSTQSCNETKSFNVKFEEQGTNEIDGGTQKINTMGDSFFMAGTQIIQPNVKLIDSLNRIQSGKEMSALCPKTGDASAFNDRLMSAENQVLNQCNFSSHRDPEANAQETHKIDVTDDSFCQLIENAIKYSLDMKVSISMLRVAKNDICNEENVGGNDVKPIVEEAESVTNDQIDKYEVISEHKTDVLYNTDENIISQST